MALGRGGCGHVVLCDVRDAACAPPQPCLEREGPAAQASSLPMPLSPAPHPQDLQSRLKSEQATVASLQEQLEKARHNSSDEGRIEMVKNIATMEQVR